VGDFVALVAEEVRRARGDLDHVAGTDAQNVAAPNRDLELARDPRHPLDLVGVDVFWGGTAGGQKPVQPDCIFVGRLKSKPFARYRILDVCAGHARAGQSLVRQGGRRPGLTAGSLSAAKACGTAPAATSQSTPFSAVVHQPRRVVGTAVEAPLATSLRVATVGERRTGPPVRLDR